MTNIASIATSFNAAASQYDEHALLQQEVLSHTASLLKSAGHKNTLLDVGCGTGNITHFFPASSYFLCGVDIAQSMVKKSVARGVRAICADAMLLPYSDHSFDGVISSLCLQWVDGYHRAIAEIVRVMKPDAHAAIAVIAHGSLKELRHSFSMLDDKEHTIDFLTHNSWVSMVEESSVIIEKKEEIQYTYYYDSVREMAHNIKAIGASNNVKKGMKGLMTPAKWQQLEAQYTKNYASDAGLPVSWHVSYILLRKV